MKLTKLQRHTAYIIMLAEAETDFEEWSMGWGLCHLINHVFGLKNIGCFWKFNCVIEQYFPELQNKKGFKWPIRNASGWQKRIKLLKQCIEETY